MNVGLKQLKVTGRGKDGGRKRVPVSRGHRDKRFGESVGSLLIQFDSERVLGVLTNKALGAIIDFNSFEQTPW